MRLPVAFVPHGGGPWPFVDFGVPQSEIDSLSAYLRSVRELPKEPPRALLVVSAHWEEAKPTVMSSPAPPMLYDYFGFPPAAYELQWPAPGEPKLAARVRELLDGKGFTSAENATRGYDHGTFVPLKVTWPEAQIPVVQLSLKGGLDAREHLELGRAVAPLRDEGVFILGSGNTFHNMRTFGDARAVEGSEKFDEWLRAAATASPRERDDLLAKWTEAPYARACHPREEHLLPLMFVAGAAGDDRGATTWSGTFMKMHISAFHYG
jgi:aromatic ring-opening dioxygenase catalytic subunit (LigB family)